MSRDHDFTDAEIFYAVVTEGGFTAASRRLELPQSTLSRRIGRLEQRLSAALLTRTTRRVALTELGEEYFERCKAVVPLLQDAERAVLAKAAQPEGTVRVAAPTSTGRICVVPLLAELCRRYPKLNIEISLIDRHINLVDEGFDVAIMIGDLPDSSFARRILSMLPLGIYGSPDYIARCGAPAHPRELEDHECIFYRGVIGRLDWRFIKDDASLTIQARGHVSINDTGATLEAALAGLGFARLTSYLAREHLHTGELIEVLADWQQPHLPVSIVYAPSRKSEAKIKAFVDFIASEIRF